MHNLKELSLESVGNDGDFTTMNTLVDKCAYLEKLRVNFTTTIKDEGAPLLRLSSLTFLNLRFYKITDATLYGIAKTLLKVKELDIGYVIT